MYSSSTLANISASGVIWAGSCMLLAGVCGQDVIPTLICTGVSSILGIGAYKAIKHAEASHSSVPRAGVLSIAFGAAITGMGLFAMATPATGRHETAADAVHALGDEGPTTVIAMGLGAITIGCLAVSGKL